MGWGPTKLKYSEILIRFCSPHAGTLKSPYLFPDDYVFGLALSEEKFRRVMEILQERFGVRWKEVYDENEIICYEAWVDYYRERGYDLVKFLGRGKDHGHYALMRKGGGGVCR